DNHSVLGDVIKFSPCTAAESSGYVQARPRCALPSRPAGYGKGAIPRGLAQWDICPGARYLPILQCSAKDVSEAPSFIYAQPQPPHRIAQLANVVGAGVIGAPHTGERREQPWLTEVLHKVERVHGMDLLVLRAGVVLVAGMSPTMATIEHQISGD